jgi:integrase
MPSRRRKLAEAIYADRYGVAATVKVGRVQKEKRFAPDTPIKQMRAWQTTMRAQLRQVAPASARGSLTPDVDRYLARVEPTHLTPRAFRQRRRDIRAWLPRFGARVRASLTAAELNDQLWTWRQTRSASCCNSRRAALHHLWRVLDGKAAPNPVAETEHFRTPDPVPKAVPLERIDQVLAALDPTTKTSARLRLMRWTGMRPSQMGRIPADQAPLYVRLQADPPHVVVPRGKRGRVVRVPLLSRAARKAAADFVRLQAFGAWSTQSANKRIAKTCTDLEVPRFTLYQIKHTVGSRLREVMDLADVQTVFGHTDASTTAIYAAPVPVKIIAGFKHLRVRKRRARA